MTSFSQTNYLHCYVRSQLFWRSVALSGEECISEKKRKREEEKNKEIFSNERVSSKQCMSNPRQVKRQVKIFSNESFIRTVSDPTIIVTSGKSSNERFS